MNTPRQGHRRILDALLAGSLVLVLAASAFAQDAVTYQYVYDSAGQLTKVIDSAGNVIEYVYDATGNILEIKRSTLAAPGSLSIISFSPQSGGAGTTVTISGQGFSATPSGNIVRFNGIAATVVSAAETTLVVRVPNGATTGFISVAVGPATATSATQFTVLQTPVILSASPRFTLTNAGLTSVQVTGLNLSNSTFAFIPALVPPGIVVTSASVNAAGTAATLNVSVNANAVGTFVVVATNAAGSSEAFSSTANSLTVLGPGIDNDGDGLLNSAEVAAGTDPLNPDTDGDGMTDGFEVRFSLNPLDAGDAGQDADGDGLTNLEEFRQGTSPRNPDRTAPVVTQVAPADGATNHPINGVVVVRFSEPLQPASVVAGTVGLSRGTTGLAGTVTLSVDGLSVTFTPSLELAPETLHTVRVQNLRDLAGNPMAAPFTSAFTTGIFVDSTPPTVLRTNPTSGASNVPVNTPFTVEFSERMDLGTLTQANFTVRDNTTGQLVAGLIQADASGRTVSFVQTQPFPIGRSFSVFLGNEIRDAAGNRLSNRSFNFTTAFDADNDQPSLTSNSPADGDENVPLNGVVTLQFNEPVNEINARRGIQITAGGAPVEGSFALSDGNRRVTFTPAMPLGLNTIISVTTTAQITDLAGNTLINPGAFSFTTGAALDNTRPSVTGVNPANGATGVGTNASVLVRFSERINPATVNNSTFLIVISNLGLPVEGAVGVAADRRSATFTPADPLLAGTTYTVQAFNFTDLAAQEAFFFSSIFTTALGPDNVAPTVVRVSPPDGATNVPVNARVVVDLSEMVNPVSVGPNAVVVTRNGANVPGTTALSSDRTSLVFIPTNPLAASSAYALAISNFADPAGNAVTPFNSTFTTGASTVTDATRPSVTSITPADSSAFVPVNTSIVLTYNEPIAFTSVNENTVRVFVQVTGTNISGTYAVSGQTVTFMPFAPLPASTRIGVQTSGVEDFAGNGSNFLGSTFDTAATADTTPPQVLSVTPTDGMTGVGQNARVVLVFSESLDPATITTDNFALFAGTTRISASVSRSSDNRTVTFNASLPQDSLITIIATPGVRDLSGNSLTDFRSQFTTIPTFDTDRPSVVSQRPGNGANDVTPTTSVVLYVNMPLNPATVPGAFHLSQNGVPVGGTLNVIGNGQVIEFTPSTPLLADALVQVFLNTTAQDLAGNALNNYQGSFRTAASTATTPPRVVRTSTANRSNLPRNMVVEVEYNEPLDPATVGATSVVLRQNTGGQPPVTSTVSLVRGGRVIRLVPNTQLAASTSHFVQVTTAVRDLDGTAPQSIFNSFFTTGTATDTVAPLAEAISPPDGSTNVGVNAHVRVRFSETVNPLTVTGQSVLVMPMGGTAAMPSSISFTDNDSEVLITPHSPLPPSTQFTIKVEGVEDLGGNPVVLRSTQFTTGAGPDNTAPHVVNTNPFNGATDVPINGVITLDIDEPVDPLTVNANTIEVRDNTTFQQVPGTLAVGMGGRTITFVPNAPLAVGRSHSVFFSSRGTLDLAGNFLTGQNFSFTVSFAADATAPQVSGVSPDNGLTGVPINAEVVVEFNEAVQSESIAAVTLNAGGSPVPVTRSLSDGNRRLTLKPSALLGSSTQHTVNIGGVRDLAGNQLAAPVTSTFTTGSSPDLTRPSVIGVNPPNGSTGVGVNVSVVIQFSERIDPLTVNASSFRLMPSQTGIPLRGTFTVAADRRSASFTPSSLLQLSTSYTVQVFGITDLSGQEINFFGSSFTTALGPDTTAPTVNAVSPTNGATNVPVNARIIVRISEPVSSISVGLDALRVTQNGTPVAGTTTLSSDRTVLTFMPTNPLSSSIVYAVSVGNFNDQSGNAVVPFNSTFTTSASTAADTTRPSVTSFNPVSGASNVPVNTSIVLTYSEPVAPMSVNPNTVRVFVQGIGQNISGTYAVNGNSVTFTPFAPLPPSVTIVIHTSGVEDFAGNDGTFSASSFDTAATADTTPPQVLTVTPSDGMTGVGQNTSVVLTFSEPLNPQTVSNNSFALFAGSTRINASTSHSADNRTVTLTTTLPSDTVVTVIVTNEVRDLAGNSLPDFRSQFTTAPAFDTDRPSVVSQRPGNGASGAPVSTSVVLYINMPLDPATVPGALHVSQNGVVVNGTVNVTANGQVIEFTPAASLQPDALVQVFLDTTAQDPAGNALHNYQGSFRTAASTATTPPRVVRTSIPNMQNVVLNPAIEIEYNEPLDPASVNTTNVSLRQNTGGQPVVASTVTLVRGGRVIRLVPNAPLAANTQHFYRITTAIRDLDGTAPTSESNFFFTTGNVSDTTTPQVTALSPPDGATGIGVNAHVRVRFSERINPLSITGQSVLVMPAGGAAAMPSSISFTHSDTEVLITPHSPLPPSTILMIKVEGVEDLAGNAVVVRNTQFTTGNGPDNTAPHVVNTNPFNGATEVPVNSAIILEVDEAVDPQTVSANTTEVRDNTTFQQVPGTYSVSMDGRTITFTPNAPLAVGRSHSVFFSSRGILDFAGNFLTGPNFSFTTSFAADTTAPQVTGVSPNDGLTGVPINAEVIIEFSEAVQSQSVSQVTLSVGGNPVSITRTLSEGNRRLRLKPSSLLTASTTHTISIGGVRDLAGNLLTAPVTSTFTTGTGADLTRPSVTENDPASGATGVPLNVLVRLGFSERVNPLTVNTATFRVITNQTGVAVAGNITVAADGRSASFAPTGGLAPSTSYSVQVSGINDLTGLDTGFSQGSFTTGTSADNTAPAVSAVSPPDGATNVPVNARVIVRLSEPVSAVSFGGSAFALRLAGTPIAGAPALSNDRRTLTFTPAAPLTASSSYTVEVGGFTDLANNVASPFTSSFDTGSSATADTTRPTVSSVNPVNGATGVPVNAAVVVTFSETVNPTTISSTTMPLTVQATGVLIGGTYFASGNSVTFTPSVPLPGNTRLHLSVSGVEDLAGNDNSFFTSNFDTSGVADTTPPQVTMITPTNNATDIATTAAIVLTFSEPLNPSTVNSNSFALFADGTRLSISVNRSADNQTVTLTTTLPEARLITVLATQDVQDLSGNRLADFRSQFTTADVDTSRPSVISQRPGNGANNIPLNSSVVLYVNEPLNQSTIAGAFQVSQNGVVVGGTLNVTGNGQVIEFTPSAPLQPDALVQVFLDTTAQDLAGNSLNNYQGSFRTVANTSNTAPQAVRTSPNNTSAVLLNPVIEIEYNEPLDPATVSNMTASLRQNTGAEPVVASTVSLVRGGRVVRIVPNAPLMANTSYFSRVTTGVRDLDGTAQSGDFTRFFTTGTATDNTAPQALSVTPPDGATGVGVNAHIRVRFSEPVNPLSVTGQSVLVMAMNGAAAMPSSISFTDGDREVLITPHSPLPAATTLMIKVEGVEDLAGNAVMMKNTQFTTGNGPDVSAPRIINMNPFNGATDVPVNSLVVLEANEPVDPQTVSANSLEVRDNTIFQQVPGTYSVSTDGRTITFTPNAALTVGRSHSVFFSSRGITDLAGGLLTGSNFSFTTSFAADTTAPQVTGVSPAASLMDVPINAEVVIEFSEAVESQSVSQVTLSVGSNPVSVTRTLSEGNRRLRLRPSSPLAASTAHTISIGSVRDLAGNLLAAPVTSTFTTGTGADLIRPSVTAVNPPSGTTGLGTNTTVTLQFNERVNPLTVNASTFRLLLSNNGVAVAGVVTVAADGRSATFTPSGGLAASTSYTVQVSGIADLTGQDVPFFQSSFTTGPQ